MATLTHLFIHSYHTKGTCWAVVLCDFCGSSGAHIACDDMLENESSYYVCSVCEEINGGTDQLQELAEKIGNF